MRYLSTGWLAGLRTCFLACFPLPYLPTYDVAGRTCGGHAFIGCGAQEDMGREAEGGQAALRQRGGPGRGGARTLDVEVVTRGVLRIEEAASAIACGSSALGGDNLPYFIFTVRSMANAPPLALTTSFESLNVCGRNLLIEAPPYFRTETPSPKQSTATGFLSCTPWTSGLA